MVYIVGIGHSIQCDKNFSFSITKKYINDMKKLVIDSDIKLIAEEFSIEALSIQQPPILSTTTKDLSKELKIQHKYCDPNSEERKVIGWNSAHDDILRLKNWLEKIIKYINYPIIFICGNRHVLDFAKIIKDKGYDVSICHKIYLSKNDIFNDRIQ